MMLLRRLLLFFILLLAAPALAVPALWTASKNGRTITLYGTIHALPQGTDWFTPKARAAFSTANTLVVEMVPPKGPGATAELMQQIGFLPAPVPIESRLPADVQARYAAVKPGIPAQMLDTMKSWLAAISLVQLEMLGNGIDPAAGVDVTLLQRAQAAGTRTLGLETPRGQLELFNGLPEAEQRLLLAAAVTDIGKSGEMMRGLIAMWLAGDVERIRRDFDDSGLSPELERRLLRDRNAAWADFVARGKAPGRRVFMAVGAAHMAGPDSLIEMLKARGFKVRRVE